MKQTPIVENRAGTNPQGRIPATGAMPLSGKHEYLPALDGLRGVSILLVLVAHAWLGHIVPGGLGVTIFFFISGFIITRLMLTEWDAKGQIDVGAFYIRRVCRLMPALLGFIAICILVLETIGSPYSSWDVLATLFYFANYRSIAGAFTPGIIDSPFVITWSLSVEEHYYFVFPFLFALLASDTKRLLGTMLALMALILAWRCWLVWGVGLEEMTDYRIYKATDTRFDSILYGACVAVLYHRLPQFTKWMHRPGAFLIGAALMLLSLLWRDPEIRETVRYSIQGVGIALMFGTLVFGKNPLSGILGSPIMVYVGRISYSLYLFHWLAFVMVDHYMAAYSVVIRFPALIITSFLLAHFSYRRFETWGGRWRRRLPAVTRYAMPPANALPPNALR